MEDFTIYLQIATYAITFAVYFKLKKYIAVGVQNFNSSAKFFIVSLIFIGAYSAFTICDGHNWGGDFSQYIAQARAILNGEISLWQEKQMFITNNSTPGFCPLVYPWGFPLLLLPVYKIFGLNLIAFKILEALFFFGAVAIFFSFLKMKFSTITAAAISAIILVNVNYLFFIDSVLTELPTLFFSLLAIFVIYKRKLSADHKIFYSVLTGATIFFCVEFRMQYVALLMALFLDDIFSLTGKKICIRSLLETAIPYFVYATATLINYACFPSNNAGYFVTFSFNPIDIFNQVKSYLYILGGFFLPPINSYFMFGENFISLIVAIIWLALVIIGMIKNFAEDRILIFYSVITMAILCTFNTFAGIRYTFGVIPIFIYFAFIALKNFDIIALRNGIAFSVIVSELIFSIIYAGNFPSTSAARNESYSKDAVEVYNFINKNIADTEVIYFFKPRVLYLNTNVYTYGATSDSGAEDLNRADYILLTADDWYTQLKELTKNSVAYDLIFENEKFKLYKINR